MYFSKAFDCELRSFKDQINAWLLWTVAITIGCAAGWAGGEALGQMTYHSFGWTIGHLVGWGTFEIVIWTMRWQVLRRVSTVPVWRRLDSLIWMSSELLGWALSEGMHRLTPRVWVTASAVWGIAGGAAVWFIFVCVHQAKSKRWFILTATIYGLLGFIGAIVYMTYTMLLVDQVQRLTESMAVPALGWLLSGASLGALSGSMTGLAVAHLWFRMLTSD